MQNQLQTTGQKSVFSDALSKMFKKPVPAQEAVQQAGPADDEMEEEEEALISAADVEEYVRAAVLSGNVDRSARFCGC